MTAGCADGPRRLTTRAARSRSRGDRPGRPAERWVAAALAARAATPLPEPPREQTGSRRAVRLTDAPPVRPGSAQRPDIHQGRGERSRPPHLHAPAGPPAPAAPAPRPPDTRPAEPLRRRSPRTGREILGEPFRHSAADLRIQLLHPCQVLADGQPQPVGHRGQVKPREPPRQPGRRRRHEGRMADRNPLPHDESPREHVTEPPPPGRHQRGDARDDPERHQNLDHTDSAAHQRMPEPDRPTVVPHHPQPARQLPERAAVTERLHRDRPAHQHENETGDGHRELRRVVQGGR